MTNREMAIGFAFIEFAVLLLCYAAQGVTLSVTKILITLAIAIVCGLLFPGAARLARRIKH